MQKLVGSFVKGQHMFKPYAATLLIIGTAISLHAQSDFLGLPVSGYLDNISNSAAIQRNAPYIPLASMGARKDDDRFWTKRRITMSYAYADTSVDGNSGDISTHSGVAEVYVESRTGLSLNLAGVYSGTKRDFSTGEADTDAGGFALQPAQELWRFLRPGDSDSQLWLGFGGGYRAIETDFTLSAGTATTEGDSLFISPNLIYVRKITERLSGLIIPAYTMEWQNTDFGSADVDSEASLFTLTGRGDYGVSEHVTLSGFATWKRDIHMEIDGVPSSALDCHDWAEFGGSVRVAITEDIGLRAGYSYEGLHPDFSRHKFGLRLELGF